MKKGANNKWKESGFGSAPRRFAALGVALWFALALSQSLFVPLAVAPASPSVAVAAPPAAVATEDTKHDLASHSSYCHCKTCAGGTACCCRPDAPPPVQAVLTAACDESAPATPASVVVLPRTLAPRAEGSIVLPSSVAVSGGFPASPNRRAAGRVIAPDPLPPPFVLLFA